MARFEDLPTEIIDCIFSQLFIPCRDAWSEYMTRSPEADIKPLLSLTGTSRRCRSLALPILLHSINETWQSKYILNMFDAHQDLAQLTKSLSLPFAPHSKPDHSDVQDMASRLGVGNPVNYSIEEGRPETAEVCLALALCSSLERLQIRLPDHCKDNLWKNKSFRRTFNLFRIISWELETVPYLENLKYLECVTGRGSGWGRVHGIPRLLQLTPNIEVLVLRGNCGKDYSLGLRFDLDICRPALESLIEIQLLEWPLRKSIENDIDILEQVVTSTTRLTTFIYVNEGLYDWANQHPPRRLMRMLLPVQSTLRHLTLDYGERSLLPPDRGDFDSEEIIIEPRKLKRFIHLETLEISQCIYCHHQLDRKAEGVTCLADLLPLTIRKLTIYLPRHDGAVQCMECILHLGQRAIAGDFPALECVQINAHFHQWRRKNYGNHYGRWKPTHWTAEDAARKTLKYDKELANIARREEARKDKLIAAFAGSGVEIRYKAWQTVHMYGNFTTFDS